MFDFMQYKAQIVVVECHIDNHLEWGRRLEARAATMLESDSHKPKSLEEVRLLLKSYEATDSMAEDKFKYHVRVDSLKSPSDNCKHVLLCLEKCKLISSSQIFSSTYS